MSWWIREAWTPLLSRLSRRQSGQGLTEYGLILVIVSIAAVVLIMSMGPKIADMFSGAGASLK
jgi:pilus assembly protein Flp/PilA